MNVFTVGIVGSEIVDYSFLKNKFLYMTSGKKMEGYTIRIAVRGEEKKSYNANKLAMETGYEIVYFDIDSKVHVGSADGVRNGRFLRRLEAVMFFFDKNDKGHVNTMNQAKTLRISTWRMSIEEVNEAIGVTNINEMEEFIEKLTIMRNEFHTFSDPLKYDKLKNFLRTW